jgi:hypothetical protein
MNRLFVNTDPVISFVPLEARAYFVPDSVLL